MPIESSFTTFLSAFVRDVSSVILKFCMVGVLQYHTVPLFLNLKGFSVLASHGQADVAAVLIAEGQALRGGEDFEGNPSLEMGLQALIEIGRRE